MIDLKCNRSPMKLISTFALVLVSSRSELYMFELIRGYWKHRGWLKHFKKGWNLVSTFLQWHKFDREIEIADKNWFYNLFCPLALIGASSISVISFSWKVFRKFGRGKMEQAWRHEIIVPVRVDLEIPSNSTERFFQGFSMEIHKNLLLKLKDCHSHHST